MMILHAQKYLLERQVKPVIAQAASRLVMIELTYHGRPRLVEPYSYRFTRDGHTLFYGWDVEADHIKAFRLDRVENISVTDIPFEPRFVVEI